MGVCTLRNKNSPQGMQLTDNDPYADHAYHMYKEYMSLQRFILVNIEVALHGFPLAASVACSVALHCPLLQREYSQ